MVVFLVAALLTGLNALKPATVDDPAYLRQAAWWAGHPAAPLAGEALLYQTLVPAAEVAAAPVAIAWLALGHRVVGPEGWALKLWLFPFAWLLCWALAALLGRLAPGSATPLLLLTALSPAVLPSFNFMLDVPALALALAALALLAGSPTPRGAIAAGVLAGLALQTKYTAAPALFALAVFALASGRPRLGLLAVAAACAVFASLEAAVFAGAGTSPLLEYVAGRAARDPGGHLPLVTAKRLTLLAGGAGAALVPLGLTALGARRGLVWATIIAILTGFALLAFAPATLAALIDGATGGRIVNLDNVSLGWLGPALLVVGTLVTWRVARGAHAAGESPLVAALTAWLLTECALAPFVSASGSVRRVLGALVVLTLLIAARLPRTLEREPARRRDLGAVVVCGVLLGLVVWAVDVDTALAEHRSLALARSLAAGAGRIAYVGDHWGAFQDAARRAGLARVTADRDTLARGDRLIVPFGVEMRGVGLDPARVALLDSVPLPHRLPLTTRQAFYDGRQIVRRTDPRWIGARLYEVTTAGVVLRTR